MNAVTYKMPSESTLENILAQLKKMPADFVLSASRIRMAEKDGPRALAAEASKLLIALRNADGFEKLCDDLSGMVREIML